jgi:hypothetical protein
MAAGPPAAAAVGERVDHASREAAEGDHGDGRGERERYQQAHSRRLDARTINVVGHGMITRPPS